MSETIVLSNEENTDFRSQLEDSIEKYVTIEDRSTKFHSSLRYEPKDTDWENETFGNWIIDIYHQNRDPPGGRVIYNERHHIKMDNYPFLQIKRLHTRAKKVAQRLRTDTNINVCEHCERIYKPSKSKIISWMPFSNYNYERVKSKKEDESYCIGFESLFWPRIHVHKHTKSENPFFTQDELSNCKSLRMTLGYAHHNVETIGKFEKWCLKSKIEIGATSLRDGLDAQTAIEILEYTDSNRKREEILQDIGANATGLDPMDKADSP